MRISILASSQDRARYRNVCAAPSRQVYAEYRSTRKSLQASGTGRVDPTVTSNTKARSAPLTLR